jgi:hypothetical protein
MNTTVLLDKVSNINITTLLKFSAISVGAIVTEALNYILTYENKCINFSIGPGTGCEWMCNYCASMLNTSNYYFSPQVCTYQSGGCVGNPLSGVVYSCCSV